MFQSNENDGDLARLASGFESLTNVRLCACPRQEIIACTNFSTLLVQISGVKMKFIRQESFVQEIASCYIVMLRGLLIDGQMERTAGSL